MAHLKKEHEQKRYLVGSHRKMGRRVEREEL